MHRLIIIVSGIILFILLTPGLFIRLPERGPLINAALVHGIIFALLFYIISKIVLYYYVDSTHIENFTGYFHHERIINMIQSIIDGLGQNKLYGDPLQRALQAQSNIDNINLTPKGLVPIFELLYFLQDARAKICGSNISNKEGLEGELYLLIQFIEVKYNIKSMLDNLTDGPFYHAYMDEQINNIINTIKMPEINGIPLKKALILLTKINNNDKTSSGILPIFMLLYLLQIAKADLCNLNEDIYSLNEIDSLITFIKNKYSNIGVRL
jgi:hypothetical protein